MPITKQPAWRGITGDVDIRPAVIVIVRRNRRHWVRTGGSQYSRGPAHIRECSIAVVVKELNESCGKAARPAIHGHSLPCAIGILARSRQPFQSRVEIVGDKKIQSPVAIVVHPRTARPVTHSGLSKSCFLGYIGESSVSVVVIKHVAAIVGNE